MALQANSPLGLGYPRGRVLQPLFNYSFLFTEVFIILLLNVKYFMVKFIKGHGLDIFMTIKSFFYARNAATL